MRILTALAATALLVSSTVAFAGDYSDPCPPTDKKQKVNAGVGNGSEFGYPESNDRDPGNSQAHNQAGKNSYKPNSDAAAVMP